MNITVNRDVFRLLKDYNICSDQYGTAQIILCALYYKEYELLDFLDEENKDKLILEVYKDLEIKGLLEKAKSSEEKTLFKLTEQGNILVQQLTKLAAKTEFKKVQMIGLDWIPEWINLWKNPANNRFYKAGPNEERSLGASLKDVQNKFIGFLTYYIDIFEGKAEKEIQDIIMQTTIAYIKKQKETGFMYTRNMSYFISKQNGSIKDTKNSDLAMLCEEFINSKPVVKVLDAYNTSINN